MKKLLSFLDKISPPRKVFAHCDVPCGVYEIDSMSWAVETCMKMVEKIQGLQAPVLSDKQAWIEYQNTLVRSIEIKEKYAQICKEQALILWTDYFKPEHFAANANLSELVLKVAKQCSAVKRSVKVEEVKKLHDFAHELADVFRKTKNG